GAPSITPRSDALAGTSTVSSAPQAETITATTTTIVAIPLFISRLPFVEAARDGHVTRGSRQSDPAGPDEAQAARLDLGVGSHGLDHHLEGLPVLQDAHAVEQHLALRAHAL